jgi:tetratricopeptide (TPR) repeat protein
MRSRINALFSVGAIVAVTVFAFCSAAAADDKAACKTAAGEAAIEACSRAIDSKKYKGRNLSLLYTNRGIEHARKGDHDRAIADHDQAIKLDPKNAYAFNNRGTAYRAQIGAGERAIADFDQAIKLNPKYAAAFYNRGIAKRNNGDTAGGDADIAQAKQLQPGIDAPPQ